MKWRPPYLRIWYPSYGIEDSMVRALLLLFLRMVTLIRTRFA